MPNHVSHRLILNAQPRVLDAVEQSLQQHGDLRPDQSDRIVLDFESVIPPPPCIFQGSLSASDEEQNPGRNWYAWNVRRWGTKWGAYEVERKRVAPELLLYRFETAWSTPRPVIEEIAHLFPEATFYCEWIDEGWNFAGFCVRMRAADLHLPRFRRSDPDIRWAEVACDDGSAAFRAMYERVYRRTPEADYVSGEGWERDISYDPDSLESIMGVVSKAGSDRASLPAHREQIGVAS